MNKYIIKNPNNDYSTFVSQKHSVEKLKYSLVCSNSYDQPNDQLTCYKPSCLNCRVILFENLHSNLINKLDSNDIIWAVQNLQSNDIPTKLTAQYILNNNNNL